MRLLRFEGYGASATLLELEYAQLNAAWWLAV